MTSWNYINLVLCVLLLAFLCWKEWRRTKKSRLALRLVASILAVAALAFLILPLSRTIKETNNRGGEVVLLTSGYSEDSVSAFLKGRNQTPVFATDRDLISVPKKYRFLSMSEIAEIKKRGDEVHVFGYGPDQQDLLSLDGNAIVFHPPALKDGIASISWPNKIKSGEQLKVQGKFVNKSALEIRLVFSGDGLSLDTAVIPPNRDTDFELKGVPKQFGKAVYAIAAISGKDTVEKEPIPFETEQARNLKVLILAASPDFENKFLKNWLAENNSSLVTRTTISKEKYEKTFVNTTLTSIPVINTTFLDNFDLVVADASELASISKSELSALEKQVAQNGMGLIVKADSTLSRGAFFSKQFPLRQHPDNHKKEISVFIPATNGYAAALISEHPLYIQREPGTRTLIEDKESNAVVSGSIYGAGRIIYTTLTGTFTWMLSGDNKNYTAYWSYLLDQATAKSGLESSWKINPKFPVVNHPVQVHYSSDEVALPRVQAGGDFLYMAQDPDLPFQWSGMNWPAKSGWQVLMEEGKPDAWWYAYGPEDWKPMSEAERVKTTREHIKKIQEKKESGVADEKIVTVPVDKIYFYIIFLLSAAFLWIEKKL